MCRWRRPRHATESGLLLARGRDHGLPQTSHGAGRPPRLQLTPIVRSWMRTGIRSGLVVGDPEAAVEREADTAVVQTEAAIVHGAETTAVTTVVVEDRSQLIARGRMTGSRTVVLVPCERSKQAIIPSLSSGSRGLAVCICHVNSNSERSGGSYFGGRLLAISNQELQAARKAGRTRAMATAPLGSSILREWDEASKARRKELLQWLQGQLRDAHSGGFDLVSTCGVEVSLLLPRILAWIGQTTNAHTKSSRAASHEVVATDEQLACLRLFLTSPINSHVYTREFIHADGLRVLLETLQRSPDRLSSPQRCVIYRILLQIIQRGRAYKAQISQLDGELALVRGAIAAVVVTSETATPSAHLQSPVWALCRATLLEQMVGNSEYVETTHHAILFMLRHTMYMVRVFGAQILREMISATSFFFDARYCASKQTELVPHCVESLQSLNIPLQHEGLELVHTLLQQPSTRRPICTLLASWIHEAALAADHLDATYASMLRTREYEVYSHLRSPFVHAAQSLTTLLNSKPRLLPLLVDKHEILIPMAFVLTVERPQSLKWLAALTAIHFIFTRCYEVSLRHLSELFMLPIDRLAELPPQISSDELAQELVGDDAHRQLVGLQFHRNGWIRPMGPPPAQDDPNATSEDARLDAIAYAMDAAVNPVLPSCLLESSPSVEDEDTLTDDDLDFAAQQRLQQKLEVHFRRFREFIVPAHMANYPKR